MGDNDIKVYPAPARHQSKVGRAMADDFTSSIRDFLDACTVPQPRTEADDSGDSPAEYQGPLHPNG